jgi:glucan phosphorylase
VVAKVIKAGTAGPSMEPKTIVPMWQLHKKLYTLLEKDIVPLYYDKDGAGVPQGWVRVMKESIKSTTPHFSSRRMVKEYALKFYQEALKYANDIEPQIHLNKAKSPVRP